MRISNLLLSTAILLSPVAASAAFAPTTTMAPAQMAGVGGWSVDPIYTIGDSLPNGFRAVGIPDGIGAYALNDRTIRVYVNGELGNNRGYAYSLADFAAGQSVQGARVTFFDIDKATRGVVDAGLAYSKIIDRAGNVVTMASQIGNGFNRFCSSSLFEANSFGGGRGLSDRLYMTGEENGNGSAFALDPATGTMHALPDFGRASYENVALVDTGRTDKVAFLIGDDSSGANMRLYVGTKDANSSDILERNGLKNGKLYAWVSDAGDTDPSTFRGGNGDSRTGSWVELTVKDTAKAGTAGYDALGYADNSTLTAEANAQGAAGFARVEDLATNPKDGSLVAFATTGSSYANGADTWGTIYTLDIDFDADGNPSAGKMVIAYNGDQDAAFALRSPDNLDWKNATTLLIQEDRSANWNSVTGANPNEAGILEVGLDGSVTAVARMTRAVPDGQTDTAIGDLGNWESSGILDISALFGRQRGQIFLADVQAHGIKLGNDDLVEGGQLFFLNSPAVPEPSTWAMLIAGFGFVGLAARRRRRACTTA